MQWVAWLPEELYLMPQLQSLLKHLPATASVPSSTAWGSKVSGIQVSAAGIAASAPDTMVSAPAAATKAWLRLQPSDSQVSGSTASAADTMASASPAASKAWPRPQLSDSQVSDSTTAAKASTGTASAKD